MSALDCEQLVRASAHLNRLFSLPNLTARFEFVRDTTQPPVVNRNTILGPIPTESPLIRDHLWGMVRQGSGDFRTVRDGWFEGPPSGATYVGAAKIGDADIVSKIDENVFWFDVTVDDPCRVDGGNSCGLDTMAPE